MRKCNLLLMLLFAGIAAVCQNYPVAVDDFYTCDVGDTIFITPLENDYDPLGHELRIFNGGSNYIPEDTIMFIATGYHVGVNEYPYHVCRVDDPFEYSNEAKYTVTVEGEPIDPLDAVDDYIEVPVNGSIVINVAENDTFLEYNAHRTGLYNMNKSQELGYGDVYFETVSFYAFHTVGLDSCYYVLEDQIVGISDTAWVYINVTEGTPEVIASDDHYSARAGYSQLFSPQENDTPTTGQIVALLKNDEERFSIHDNQIRYDPPCRFSGRDSVDYLIQNNNQYSRATLVVDVDPCDSIPIANDDIYSVMKGVSHTLNILDNDVQYNDVEIEIEDLNFDDDYSLSIDGNSLVFISETPRTDPVPIRYRTINTDNELIISNWAHVTIRLEENDNIPIAHSDTVTVNYDHTMTISGFLANDIDPEGYELEISSVYGNLPVFHNAFIDGPDEIRVASGVNTPTSVGGIYELKYMVRRVDQPDMISEPASIFINIIRDINKPVAFPDTVYCYGSAPVTIDVGANDDIEGLELIDIQFYTYNLSLYSDKDYSHCSVKNDGLTATIYPSFGFKGWTKCFYRFDADNQPMMGSAINVYIDNKKTQSDYLDANNIKALFNSTGVNFHSFKTPLYNDAQSYSYGKPAFICDGNLGEYSALDFSSLWISGLSDENVDHYSGDVAHYRVTNMEATVDFQPGPIADSYNDTFKEKYVRLWKIDRGMIANHVNNYTNPSYEMPPEIQSWPGNGNPANGEDEQLAPYFDKNENTVYDPENGDYPLIRGDQTIYYIINDDIEHTESYGLGMKTEVHVMAYAFDMPEDKTFSNTIFIHYDVYNRSDRNYNNTSLGIYNRSMMEFEGENKFGTDVSLTSTFIYHGSENGVATGAVSTTILGGPLLPDDGIDNPYGGCDESITGSGFGDGLADNERYGLMGSITPSITQIGIGTFNEWAYQWSSARIKLMNLIPYFDDHLLFGGNGTFGNTLFPGPYGPECRYMFPWDSDPCNFGLDGQEPNGPKDWRDENDAGFRDGLSISGPFTFEAGSKEEFDIAYVYAYDPEDFSDTPSVNLLKERIADLLQKRDNGEIYPYFITETGIEDSPQAVNTALIFPSPALNHITVRAALKEDASYSIFSSTGVCMMSGIMTEGIQHPLSINKLNTGIYIIKIENNSTQYTGKFMVQ